MNLPESHLNRKHFDHIIHSEDIGRVRIFHQICVKYPEMSHYSTKFSD